MNAPFAIRADQDALIVSFPAPVRALSWAVLNGGFCHADHVINPHVRGSDRLFSAQPEREFEQAAVRLRLMGKVVAMATAVEMKNLVQASLSGGNAEVTCFATVGCGNALSVGDSTSVTMEETAPSLLHICVTCDSTRHGPAVLGRSLNPQTDIYSTCCAIQNLWLAARAEGLGVGWVSILSEQRLKEILRIPSHIVVVGYLCVGYPARFEPKPELETAGWLHRLQLRDVIFDETWDGIVAGD